MNLMSIIYAFYFLVGRVDVLTCSQHLKQQTNKPPFTSALLWWLDTTRTKFKYAVMDDIN